MGDAPKPRARPQSLMAQSFSMALDNVFGLEDDSELAQSVEKKKQAVTTQSAELQALEARLKAMEERLRTKQRSATISDGSDRGARPGPAEKFTGNAGAARPTSRQAPSSNSNAAKLPLNAGARGSPAQGSLRQKIDKSSEEDDSEDDSDEDEGDDDEEEEEDEQDDSETEDSSSTEERKR